MQTFWDIKKAYMQTYMDRVKKNRSTYIDMAVSEPGTSMVVGSSVV